MDRDRIIRLIREQFLEGEWYQSPRTYHMKRAYFEQEALGQWATREILWDMEDRTYWSPLDCISVFKSRMDDYACRNSRTSYIFSVAYDKAEEIEDFIIALMAD